MTNNDLKMTNNDRIMTNNDQNNDNNAIVIIWSLFVIIGHY